MKIYIRSSSAISPQSTFGAKLPNKAAEYVGDKLTCVEPDYNSLLDPKLIRRMSRIIRMGSATALNALQEAKLNKPDAIIIGTAYGCMEDTEIFLRKMIQNQEELLTPTSFIQSTHNTVGAQIALICKCHEYNNTFVQNAFSFETALLDGLLMLQDNEAKNLLVGGIDEIIPSSHTILNRFGLYRTKPVSNLDLVKTPSKGTMAGEGAAFFVITNQESAENKAELRGIDSLYKPENFKEAESEIKGFLEKHSIGQSEIDLVITGKNGDQKDNIIYDKLDKGLFKGLSQIAYKQYCGEYPTSTSFALWLATHVLENKIIPEWLLNGVSVKRPVRNILIYNHYQNKYHSLFFMTAC